MDQIRGQARNVMGAERDLQRALDAPVMGGERGLQRLRTIEACRKAVAMAWADLEEAVEEYAREQAKL